MFHLVTLRARRPTNSIMLRKCRWAGLVLVGLTGCDPRITRASLSSERPPATPTDRPKMTFSVMTYNLNYGLAPDSAMISAIDEENSDLVFLQETTEAWETALLSALGERYPYRAFRHCCIAGGLGLLSKFPIEPKDYVEPPEGGWFPSWRFLVDTPVGRVQALNVHLRPQLSASGSYLGGVFVTPAIREDEIARYHALLEPGLPTLIAGDFNENRRGRAINYLAERGYVSAAIASGSDDTWRWQTSVGQISERLDHIVHDPSLEVSEHRVLPRGNSDHLPLVAIVARR